MTNTLTSLIIVYMVDTSKLIFCNFKKFKIIYFANVNVYEYSLLIRNDAIFFRQTGILISIKDYQNSFLNEINTPRRIIQGIK